MLYALLSCISAFLLSFVFVAIVQSFTLPTAPPASTQMQFVVLTASVAVVALPLKSPILVPLLRDTLRLPSSLTPFISPIAPPTLARPVTDAPSRFTLTMP